MPGTCSCAVVRCVLCALPGFAAPGGRCCFAPVTVPWLRPAACLCGVRHGASLVRGASSGPVALGAPVSFLDSLVPFPIPGACAPGFTGRLRGARGGWPRTGIFVPASGPCRGWALCSLRVVSVRGPAIRLSLARPSSVALGLRALRWFACADPVTDASGFPYRSSFDGGLCQCSRAVSCGRRHSPFRVGGRHAQVRCVCAYACPSWLGKTGRPPGPLLVRLTFFYGQSWCALCLFAPPPGWGCPGCCCCWVLRFDV